MIELPQPGEIVPRSTESPRRMIVTSLPKVGKTSAWSFLPNHLIIDLEDGSEFVNATKVNIKKEAAAEGIDPLTYLYQVAKKIQEANKKNKGPVYEFIIIDTTTALEDMARTLATEMYKKSPIGKNYQGTDVINDLEFGSGYGWLRAAFDRLYNEFDGLAGTCLILSGHVKSASIKKKGKDVSVRDINLTGKLKHIVCADADAIGFMYRDKDGITNIISFKSGEDDLVTGARTPHLRGKDIPVTKLVDPEKDEFESYWDKIFIDI